MYVHTCVYIVMYIHAVYLVCIVLYKYTYVVAMVIAYHVCAMVAGGTVLGHVLGQ